MDFNDFYAEVGGDYNEVISRLGKDDRIIKYLMRFSESDSLSEFDSAFTDRNCEECFRALHSIKGMCLNLGLGNLGNSSSELCEKFRNGLPDEDVSEMILKVKSDFAKTLDSINKLQK